MNQVTPGIPGEENKPAHVVAALHLAGGNKPDPTTPLARQERTEVRMDPVGHAKAQLKSRRRCGQERLGDIGKDRMTYELSSLASRNLLSPISLVSW